MKREKRLTKRDRKELKGPGLSGSNGGARGNGGGTNDHIHCVACGRHIDPTEFGADGTATSLTCEHKSAFPSCATCVPRARELLAEHDRTGQPVKTAGAWH